MRALGADPLGRRPSPAVGELEDARGHEKNVYSFNQVRGFVRDQRINPSNVLFAQSFDRSSGFVLVGSFPDGIIIRGRATTFRSWEPNKSRMKNSIYSGV